MISLIYLVQYFYESYYQYLIIDDNTITKPNIFDTQKIKISEITRIKKFAGDIRIYSKDSKIGLAKNLIEPQSYEQLEKILEKYTPVNDESI